MADLDNKQKGASSVDQSKDIDELDETPKANDRPLNDAKDKDLERGQELYTGFGFGGVDDDVDVKEIRTSVPTAKVSESEKSAVVEEHPKKTVPSKKAVMENRRVVPEDTKVVIKADNGDVVYKESSIERTIESPESIVEERQKLVDTDHSILERDLNKESSGDITTDYQLDGVYYGNDFRDNKLYLTRPYQTDIYSIKRHYKNQARDRKNALPIKKIALGIAAIAGAVWLIRDDEKGFWEYWVWIIDLKLG